MRNNANSKTKWLLIIGVVVIVLWGFILISFQGLELFQQNLTALSSTKSDVIWEVNTLAPHEIVETSNCLEFLWSQPNIFIPRSSGSSLLVATNGLIYIAGSFTQTQQIAITALQGVNGEQLWQSNPGIRDALYATPDALYSGMGNSITSYDLNAGKVLWSQRLPRGRNVYHLYVVDNIIYTVSTPFHLVQADTGQVIQTFSHFPTETELQKIAQQLRKTMPSVSLKGDYFLDNAFTKEASFRRTHSLTNLRAIDRETDTTLWEIEEGVKSNVVATETIIYLFTLDGDLLGLDPYTGKGITLVKFGQGSFSHNSHYYVAIDEVAQLLYVYLGDTYQLFAFKLTGDNWSENSKLNELDCS